MIATDLGKDLEVAMTTKLIALGQPQSMYIIEILVYT